MNVSRAATIAIRASMVLYAVSLALPAFACHSFRGSAFGYEVLLTGWMGILSHDFRWLANPLVLILMLIVVSGLKVYPHSEPNPVLSIFALAACVFAVWSVLAPASGCAFNAGAPTTSYGLGIGGYLWVASIFLASGAFFALYLEQDDPADDHHRLPEE